MEQLGTYQEKVIELATTYGIKVVGVLVMLFFAWIVAGMLRNWTIKAMNRTNLDTTVSKYLGNIVRYSVLVFAAVGCLGVFGIQTASFAAVLAASGLAIGLAFQGSLSNLAAGFMLLIFRPFKVGDFVMAAGEAGTVEEIEMFSTTLKTPDNRKIIVPNGGIFGGTIQNVTAYDTRRVDVPVGVAYDSDIDQTKEVLERAVKNVEGIMNDPAHQLFLDSLGASSVDWVVRVWCATSAYWDVKQALVRSVKMELDKAGIGIPFPQMDIHFDGNLEDVQVQPRVKEANA